MKVHIGSLDYDLTTTTEPLKSVLLEDTEDNDFLMGLVEEPFCKITISKNFPKQTREQSFWHETVHAMMAELGQRDLYDDEAFIDSMAKQLHMFFKRNDIKKIYEKLDG